MVDEMQSFDEVERIEEGSTSISSSLQIMDLVEVPLLRTCRELFDKNIETLMSSANLEGGFYIDFATDSLSDENRETLILNGGEEGTMHGTHPERQIIKISLVNPQSISDVSFFFERLASNLLKQQLTWGGYSISDLEAMLGGMEEGDYDGKDKIEYWKESGYFYNERNQRFYRSQEMLRKSLDI